ncbi:hypothetical protein ILUMI_24019 [Ignelater luminosus]|uniref:Uncharacterized protein n=1 Tax=Ignelater luminosus TaxID=2038154 RepID=A0A8K0G1B3_IGNLU|nr:hypothetical protein ILUMI_24019 [Ignelater luminosus]
MVHSRWLTSANGILRLYRPHSGAGIAKIIKAREDESSTKRRIFKPPKINFSARDYTEIIVWHECQVTPPPKIDAQLNCVFEPLKIVRSRDTALAARHSAVLNLQQNYRHKLTEYSIGQTTKPHSVLLNLQRSFASLHRQYGSFLLRTTSELSIRRKLQDVEQKPLNYPQWRIENVQLYKYGKDNSTSLNKSKAWKSQRLRAAHKKAKHNYNLKRRQEDLVVGSRVWRENYAISKASDYFTAKLAPRHVGPFVVRRRISPNFCELESAYRGDKGIWHIKDLKAHPPEDEEED